MIIHVLYQYHVPAWCSSQTQLSLSLSLSFSQRVHELVGFNSANAVFAPGTVKSPYSQGKPIQNN